MKYKAVAVLTAISILIAGLTGCQTATKSYGGKTTIKLEPNQKLEEITWKDDSLWYLTRPMTNEDIAETHTFQQQSNFGVFEGTVIPDTEGDGTDALIYKGSFKAAGEITKGTATTTDGWKTCTFTDVGE